MKKKKGSCLKTVLTVFGVLIVLGVLGSALGDNDKEPNSASTQNVDTTGIEPTATNEIASQKESENTESSSEKLPDNSEEADLTVENPLGFNVLFSDTYKNDVTGNWRLARIAEDIKIEEYAIDYYNNYFNSDNEIHIIINFTLNTTTRISVMGNLLDVSIMEYVDKEEHDAKLACSGMLIQEYHINIDTGEIEKIQ